MDKQTTEIIRELANKLGTTAEHLWSVLVKQAPITATYAIALWGLFALLVVLYWTVGFQYFKKRIVKVKAEYAGQHDGWRIVHMVVGFGLIAISLLALPGPATLSGFLNPEYWALRQVLK